jgi:hypothetical protein
MKSCGVALVLLSTFACSELRDRPTRLESFRVTLQSASGTAEAPLPFVIRESREMIIDVTAIDSRGDPIPGFDGPISVSVVPGRIVSLSPVSPELRGGTLQGLRVGIRGAFGRTHIWVEDASKTNVHALGTSSTIYFQNPRLRDVQQPLTSRDSSPLEGSVVVIDRGDNYVVHVSNSGFFVVDREDTEYNSIFAFNFSRPEGVRRGDKLLRFGGNVVEFLGYTELGFPLWDVDRRCPNPLDPEQLCAEGEFCIAGECLGQQCGASVCAEGSVCREGACVPNPNIPDPVSDPNVLSNTEMEKYEGGLVRFTSVIVSHDFVACDDPAVTPGANGNGTCEFCRTCNQNRNANGDCPSGGRCCPVGQGCYLLRGECAALCNAQRNEDGSCPTGASCCPAGGTCDLSVGMCDGCSVAEKAEERCEAECNARTVAMGRICTNLCDFREFGQYRVGLTTAGAWDGRSILLNTKDTVPSFRPEAPENRGKRLDSVTGTLRNIYAPGAIWIVEARDECDIQGITRVRQDCHTVR